MVSCMSENYEGREFTKNDVKILQCLLDLIQRGFNERSKGKPRILTWMSRLIRGLIRKGKYGAIRSRITCRLSKRKPVLELS